MRIGTNRFLSHTHARRYYRPYGLTHADVMDKIERGEIAIGAPRLKAGETLSLDTDGRYLITTKGTK